MDTSFLVFAIPPVVSLGAMASWDVGSPALIVGFDFVEQHDAEEFPVWTWL